MKLFKTILAWLGLIVLFFALNSKQGSIPPLGKFFNPFAGFWQNNAALDQIDELLDVPGLRDQVQVVWDERQVPHLFASNTYDVYFAQGFLTARHRLWQMEFQTQVAAGRVSEIIGAKALEFDRRQRRRGLLMAAEKTITVMNADSETQLIIQAYADGVNAWIGKLTPATLPLEYKLLDYQPETWTTLKTALLLKFMAWDLTGRNSEMDLSIIRATLGEKFVRRFYPEDTPWTDPIIPVGKPWHFDPLSVTADSGFFEPQFVKDLMQDQPDRDNGSNNWAVTGKRTATGFPVLANDPHLGLKLPSIWYEIQLHTPEMNVYGVSLPGAPAVVIGFNQDIAWGLTNAGSDVMDWYEITFKDQSYSEYLYQNEWVPAEQRIEEIQVRGAVTVLDTFPVTRFGPVVTFGEHTLDNGYPVGLAMRWSAHEPSNEMAAIRGMNLATDMTAFFKALDQFDAPGQNFAFASATGDIAIRHNGKFPLRAQDQGKFVQAGRDTTSEWRQWIPKDQLPVISNPRRGYVSSANQNPVAAAYPYYMGWEYDDYERGSRINDRLADLKASGFQDMQNLQMDTYNKLAARMLPLLLENLERDTLDTEEQQIVTDLEKWNYYADPDQKAAWVYKQWWLHLEAAIWDDDLRLYGEVREIPTRSVTAKLLLEEPDLSYYDDRTTPKREDRQAIIQEAFTRTVADLHATLGPYGDTWQLGRARGTDIKHLLAVKGLGRPGLFTGGGSGIINACKKAHGPSWRMVVELGEHPRARGIFPGGQSGNPGSQYYDNAVDDWVQGNYYDLKFLYRADSTAPGLTVTTLRNTQ